MPRLSDSVPYDTGPVRWTGRLLLPPSRMVLTSVTTSSPPHSEKAASRSGSVLWSPRAMLTRKLRR